jgi:hypothetical protein
VVLPLRDERDLPFVVHLWMMEYVLFIYLQTIRPLH